jgi:type I restriction enzyme R subunit/putative DNA methylase
VKTQDSTTEHKGWYRHRYLPHFDQPGLIQHVCFHLADSLPQAAIERIRWEVRNLPAIRRKLELSRRLHDLLDAGAGTCLLRRPQLARIMQAALEFGEGSRYRLHAWSIMPNHVHVLIELLPGWPLGKLVQSWKRHTTKEFRTVLALEGEGGSTTERFWQEDYWDRFVRDEAHLERVIGYIEENPVMAGLLDRPDLWPWGSARYRLADCENGAHLRNEAR